MGPDRRFGSVFPVGACEGSVRRIGRPGADERPTAALCWVLDDGSNPGPYPGVVV